MRYFPVKDGEICTENTIICCIINMRVVVNLIMQYNKREYINLGSLLMETLIKIIQIIGPAIIASLGTYIVTKLNYENGKSTDKTKSVYDKVYYPIYRTIRTHDKKIDNNDIEIFINHCRPLIQKNSKYLSFSTVRKFEKLDEAIKEKNQIRKEYDRFTEHIFDYNTKIRRKLGYLEPGIIERFNILKHDAQALLVSILFLIITYIIVLSYPFATNYLISKELFYKMVIRTGSCSGLFFAIFLLLRFWYWITGIIYKFGALINRKLTGLLAKRKNDSLE